MSIVVTCPNGHRLTASDKRAGTTGRCPACGAEVHIPDPKNAPPSDSSILRILGIGEELRKRMNEEDDAWVKEHTQKTATNSDVSGNVDPNSLEKKGEAKKKICPQCDWEIDAEYKICPHCRYYFMN